MSTASLPADQPVESPAPHRGLRVVPIVVVVAGYWAVYAGLGMTEIVDFHKFLYRMGALAIAFLAVLCWWLFQRRVPLRARFVVLGAVAVAIAVTMALRHASIYDIPLIMATAIRCIEVMLTSWAVWLIVARNASTRTLCRGMAVVGAVAWLWALAVRMEGFAGDTAPRFQLRWTPSGEELFLAEQAAARAEPAADEAPAAEPLVATDADWPAFRGAARDGAVHGVEIATDWDQSPPKELWRRRVGPGWSSITVVGNRLFTQEQRAQEEAVVCFDADTGDQVWVHADPGRFDESMGGVGPRATPTFDDGMLYTLGATGILNCLDAATGDLRWSRDVKLDGQGGTPIWGFASSPLVVDGKVIVFAGGEEKETAIDPAPKPADKDALLAYDAATGDLAWHAAAGKHSYSSPQRAEFDGEPQVLFISDAMLAAFDAATGEQLWDLPTNGRRDGAPAIQPHVLGEGEFLASFNSDAGIVRGKATRSDDAWTADVTWTSRSLKPFFSDFVRVDDALYGFDGNFFCCVDATTGKRLWKQGRQGSYGSGQVLLVADQRVLVVITEAGEAVLVAAKPERHEELGRFQAIEGKTWNHPTIHGGRLYIRNAEEMACFEL